MPSSHPIDSALYCLSIVFGALGSAYLGVPLYSIICNNTGIGGTPKTTHASSSAILNPDRMRPIPGYSKRIRVMFDADTEKHLPWKFEPLQRFIQVRPGETALAFYNAKNHSNEVVTGISTYNVIPEQCAKYFNKIQCFCFEEQRLKAGEDVDMPVFFYLDKDFATDPMMQNVDELVLSYTFFRTE